MEISSDNTRMITFTKPNWFCRALLLIYVRCQIRSVYLSTSSLKKLCQIYEPVRRPSWALLTLWTKNRNETFLDSRVSIVYFCDHFHYWFQTILYLRTDPSVITGIPKMNIWTGWSLASMHILSKIIISFPIKFNKRTERTLHEDVAPKKIILL